jgi:hypothetical protein
MVERDHYIQWVMCKPIEKKKSSQWDYKIWWFEFFFLVILSELLNITFQCVLIATL